MVKPEQHPPETPQRNPSAQALIDAAETLLATEGLDGLTTRAVAERAGVNKGLVFYYWGSTSELLAEVLEHYYARHKAALAGAFSAPGNVRERIHRVIDEYLDFMEQNRTYAEIVQQQIAGGGEHLPLVQRHLRDLLALTTEMLADLTPAKGPLAARHFHLSLSAIVINYFTYAPVLGAKTWRRDPLGAAALAERREHVHWLVDAWLDRLAGGPVAQSEQS